MWLNNEWILDWDWDQNPRTAPSIGHVTKSQLIGHENAIVLANRIIMIDIRGQHVQSRLVPNHRVNTQLDWIFCSVGLFKEIVFFSLAHQNLHPGGAVGATTPQLSPRLWPWLWAHVSAVDPGIRRAEEEHRKYSGAPPCKLSHSIPIVCLWIVFFFDWTNKCRNKLWVQIRSTS